MRKIISRLPLAATLALSLAIVGCGDGGDDAPLPAPAPTPSAPTPTPTPTPGPTPTPTQLNVDRCLNQEVGGRSVASLVVPDTIQIDLSQPSGFPNGRRLPDPVVDITLAVIFLDLSVHPATTFASVPINPPMNDRTFLDVFPYLAPPQGNPPIASGAQGRFQFRDDPASAYVRVDRTGMPAVSTVFIPGPVKNAFNDDDPEDDATGKWVPDIVNTLSALHTALQDDFAAFGVTTCATP